MNKIAKINDAIDGWKTVLDYLLSRTTTRYSTLEELKEDVNEKYKNLMQTIQTNYDRWFEGELLKNLDAYNIEILGDDSDIVIEDQDEPVDEFAEEGDEQANSQIDESMFEDEQGGDESEQQTRGMKKKWGEIKYWKELIDEIYDLPNIERYKRSGDMKSYEYWKGEQDRIEKIFQDKGWMDNEGCWIEGKLPKELDNYIELNYT